MVAELLTAEDSAKQQRLPNLPQWGHVAPGSRHGLGGGGQCQLALQRHVPDWSLKD